jgi:hypothetical protein
VRSASSILCLCGSSPSAQLEVAAVTQQLGPEVVPEVMEAEVSQTGVGAYPLPRRLGTVVTERVALAPHATEPLVAAYGNVGEYTGSAGKITNCQIGVFAAYVSRHGHAFIDRTLYLPKEWTDDPDRLEAAYVLPDVGFATKPKLATRMIARAIAASVPFKWVAGDTVYGVGDIEQHS